VLSVLVPLCVALGAGDVAGASAATSSAAPSSPDVARGSVQGFADDIAAAIQQRAVAEGLHGGVRVVFDEIRGLDAARARAALWPRVKKSLKGGPLIAVDNGALVAAVALSEERGQLWAVVVVDGPGVTAPTTLVVQRALDRELEVALGTVSRLLPGRFVLERVAPLPPPAGSDRPCPVFDISLVDLDGDPAAELAVLSSCGVSLYRVDDVGVVPLAGPFPLPARRWPRVALGWLVTVSSPELGPILWAVTSAGHSQFIEARTGRVVEAPGERVPLRGVLDKDGPHALHWRLGSPVLALPLMTPGGIDVVIPGLPSRVRDLARLPGTAGWVYVSEDGTLVGRDDAGVSGALSPERVGDRLLVVDLDADGEVEVVTTTSASPGEADQLVVRRLTPAHDGSTVVLRSPLSGGSVAAFAAGHSDLDRRIDVLVVEETQDGTATLWRLEHGP
jgi:hypothetical protein